jgi:hypothetical protein
LVLVDRRSTYLDIVTVEFKLKMEEIFWRVSSIQKLRKQLYSGNKGSDIDGNKNLIDDQIIIKRREKNKRFEKILEK